MALLEVKTSYATYTDCTLRVGQYGFHVKDYIAIKEREYAENERRKAERDQDT